MKLLRARLKGLIGVCRASGLHDISIDFTKCKHKIVLIVGKNGSGKSTISDSLHPFPDPPSKYLPKEEGLKEIDYICDDGTMYHISIQYPLNKNGERATTKAYIQKMVNGEIIELNPNGNIGSYKDALYSEFKLDANFVALSQLSVENRGLVDMTPSERKKFVGNIIDSIEVYNNIHKSLNRRSSIFKSMINTIVTKIDTIGNEENLTASIQSTEMRISSLQTQKDSLTKQLAEYEARIKILDPDNSIQENYNSLYSQYASIKEKLETIDMLLANLKNKPYYSLADSKQTCEKSLLEYKSNTSSLENELYICQTRISDLLTKREEESQLISLKVARLESLTSEYNYMDLIKEIDRLRSNISSYKEMFKEMGISENTVITKEEIITGLNTLKMLKEQVDIVRSYSYSDEISTAIEYIRNDVSFVTVITDLEREIEDLRQQLSEKENKKSYIEGQLSQLAILDKRPKDCKNDECGFIKNAIDIQRKYSSKDIDRLQEEMQSIYSTVQKKTKDLEKMETISQISISIKNIMRYIANNKSILDKLPNGEIFGNVDIFLQKLVNGSTFNEINDLYKYVDRANVFELYKIDSDRLSKLESEYKIYKSKNQIIDEIQNDIDTISKRLDAIAEDIEKYQSTISEYNKKISDNTSIINTLESILVQYEDKDHYEEIQMELEKELREIARSVQSIEEAVKLANSINSNLIGINNELNPLLESREKMRYSVDRLHEYKDELQRYQSSYDLIELIKKYSSPTKNGIQNLFIKVYMGQTLNIANSLLRMLFDGDLRLDNYIIDEKEFRIPCKSLESPIINDDISSCSTAQKCMISMILSFALLQQGSTEYNIIRLDEIDFGLDQENRSMFLSVLQRIMDILNVQNCVMISHSSETVLENADIILLNPVGTEIPRGNIIFTYEECKR